MTDWKDCPRTDRLILQFYRCDLHHAIHFTVAGIYEKDFIECLREAVEDRGANLELKEMPGPFDACDWHNSQEVIENVYSVQGLKKVEGESLLPALESLVSKYAELK
jgi:hypothetical protein